MKINGSIALVTGANRGLGAAFTRALLEAGATKVYAAARTPSAVTIPGVVPVQLDLTQPAQAAALARELRDVNLLVNNAGIFEAGPVLAAASSDSLRRQFETNVVGPLNLVQAFAPILAENGGGAVVNVLSVLSWFTIANVSGAYSASKAAAWALSNAVRQELAAQRTEVLSVHAAFIDTDMARGVQGRKTPPEQVVKQVLAALEAGQTEVLVDDTTRNVHAGLVAEPPVYLATGG